MSDRLRILRWTIVAAGASLLPSIAALTLAQSPDGDEPLPSFTRITSELPVTVVLESGPISRVTMEGDSAQIARIRTEVRSDELVLRHDSADPHAFSWEEDSQRHGERKQHYDVTVRITTPSVTAITNRAGRGRIQTEAPLVCEEVEISTDAGFVDLEIESRRIRLQTRGSGVVTLRGRGETGSFDLEGGVVFADAFSLDRARVRAVGGVCDLGEIRTLSVRARGSAHIGYRGDPLLSRDLGSGATLERVSTMSGRGGAER
jgi:hypothetical protein